MAAESLTIPLTGGNVNGGNYATDRDDSQIVTLTDGGNLEGKSIQIAGFGKGNPTHPGEGPGGDDRFIIDLNQFTHSFELTFKSTDARDVIQISGWDTRTINGAIYTYTYTDANGISRTLTVDSTATNSNLGPQMKVVCFTRGTDISVAGGTRRIEDLAVGDEVLCGDGELRTIRWIGSQSLNAADLAARPHLAPIMLRRDAMGRNMPERDLYLSPQHRILVQDWRAEMLFGEEEVLVAADHLRNDRTILRCADCEEVEYFHILLDTHQTVYANGLETETLYPGEMTKTAVGGGARSEICELFPDLAADLSSFGPMYRTGLKRFQTAVLLAEE